MRHCSTNLSHQCYTIQCKNYLLVRLWKSLWLYTWLLKMNILRKWQVCFQVTVTSKDLALAVMHTHDLESAWGPSLLSLALWLWVEVPLGCNSLLYFAKSTFKENFLGHTHRHVHTGVQPLPNIQNWDIWNKENWWNYGTGMTAKPSCWSKKNIWGVKRSYSLQEKSIIQAAFDVSLSANTCLSRR